MSYPKITSDEGETRTFELKNGDIVKLKIEDNAIYFYDDNEKQLDGEFEFIYEDDYSGQYLLARMYVPKEYKRQGIGTEAVILFKSYYDVKVYARQFDGETLDDGSHLTEDAPPFVYSLIEKGILEDNRDKG